MIFVKIIQLSVANNIFYKLQTMQLILNLEKAEVKNY